MAKPVLHKQVTKARPYGELNTTLCGRLRTLSDGQNVAISDAEVTCKFCLAKIARQSTAA